MKLGANKPDATDEPLLNLYVDDDLSDVNLEAEDLDTDVDDTSEADEEVEETESEDGSEDGAEADGETEEDAAPSKEKDAPLFNREQQDEVNRLIKVRLERQETKLAKDLSKTAGVPIDYAEVAPAARLWGLLKSNPQLAKDINLIIDDALEKGRAKAPTSQDTSADEVTARLELKEAVLDLKAADPLFYKNADRIMTWAENEGYTISSARDLKLAFLAWKGSQGRITTSVQKNIAKRKQETKTAMKKQATLQPAKPGAKPAASKIDYRKMSDTDVIQAEGLSLFTDD